MSDQLTIATYNIHGGVGRDGRRDPARVGAVVAELGADLVGLQEVDSRGLGRGDADQLEVVAAVAAMHSKKGPTIVTESGEYGNAVLSRWPIAAVRRHDLTVAGREPRGALEVVVTSEAGHHLRVVVTHLGLRRGERLRQVVKLLRLLGHREDASPVALLGDFNEGSRIMRSLRDLTRYFGATPRVRSFPAQFPVLSLDRIWVRPRRALRSLGVHASPLARVASDHLPVWGHVDLEVLPPAPKVRILGRC